jgi:hypothetical protein
METPMTAQACNQKNIKSTPGSLTEKCYQDVANVNKMNVIINYSPA